MEYLRDFDIAHFQQCVLAWYQQCGRVDLPWRNLARDGSQSYEVYVSEMMLQQTQVTRVLHHYYFPFLRKFPTLISLANAKQEEVLKIWEGLGYYARARNMQKCAHFCVQHYNGNLPSESTELQKLSGIGAYSAGAIACFGFGKRVGFVDSNITRVFCRLFALQEPRAKQLFHLANTLLPTHYYFEYNQALLDLGALICAKKPKCLICPLVALCMGKDSPHLYPYKKQPTREFLHLYLFNMVFRQAQDIHIALQKSDNTLYFGLYNLPQSQNSAQILTHSTKVGLTPKHIGTFTHNYTKYAIKAEVYMLECKNLSQGQDALECIGIKDSKNIGFFTQKELSTLPLSTLAKKALHFLLSIA